ncbi:MAG: DUF456 domain-containing protein [Solirubrobacterales bacterium]
MSTVAILVAVAFILIGIAGSILPVLPGIPLIFLTILGYGWYEGFHEISVKFIAIMGILTVLSVMVDYAAGYLGAKKAGSSRAGQVGALVGVVAGMLLVPILGPLGILIGPWLGAFVGEYMVLQDTAQAARVGTWTMVGVIAGSFFKVVLGIGMLTAFLVSVLW